jgi:hypothetical protein
MNKIEELSESARGAVSWRNQGERLFGLEAGSHTLFLFCLDAFQQQFHPLQ